MATGATDASKQSNSSKSLPVSIEVDSTIDDTSYEQSLTTSSLASIASEIYRGLYENGRRYHSYGNAEYGFPNDELESERLDMQHAMTTLLLGHRLFWAPIKPNPTRILDLGTGTGIWAFDCAEIFEAAEVIGTDLSPVQPEWVPPNCTFEVDDAEREWIFAPDHFDLIFNRNFICAIRDWPRLIRQCYDHVKPGGWVELQEKYPKIESDDGSLPENSVLVRACEHLFEAGARFGAPVDAPKMMKQWMEEAGFVDVEEHIMKIPVGPWPRDPRLKKVGAFELVNLTEGLEGLTMRLFTKYLGWNDERLGAFLREVRSALRNPRTHAYVHFYVVFGRKPEEGE